MIEKKDNVEKILIRYGKSGEKILYLLGGKINTKNNEVGEDNFSNNLSNNVLYNLTSDDKNIQNAFSEVYDIIMHMNKNIRNKIPLSFINLIKNNKNDNYKLKINYNISINSQKLLKDTRTILALIYRDYIVGKDKKENLVIEEKKKEEIENKKYEIKWDIAKNVDEKKSNEEKPFVYEEDEDKIIEENTELTSEMMQLEVRKNIFFSRILFKFKNLFEKK